MTSISWVHQRIYTKIILWIYTSLYYGCIMWTNSYFQYSSYNVAYLPPSSVLCLDHSHTQALHTGRVGQTRWALSTHNLQETIFLLKIAENHQDHLGLFKSTHCQYLFFSWPISVFMPLALEIAMQVSNCECISILWNTETFWNLVGIVKFG